MIMTAVLEPMNSSPNPRTEKKAEQPAMNSADTPISNLKNHDEVRWSAWRDEVEESGFMKGFRMKTSRCVEIFDNADYPTFS